MVRVTARVPCSALTRACSATAGRRGGVLRDVVNRRRHLLDRDRRLDRLRRLIVAAAGQRLGDAAQLGDRHAHLARRRLHLADDLPQLADHQVERIGDRAGDVGGHLGVHRQVALGDAADFLEQLHHRRLHLVALLARVDERRGVVEHRVERAADVAELGVGRDSVTRAFRSPAASLVAHTGSALGLGQHRAGRRRTAGWRTAARKPAITTPPMTQACRWRCPASSAAAWPASALGAPGRRPASDREAGGHAGGRRRRPAAGRLARSVAPLSRS